MMIIILILLQFVAAGGQRLPGRHVGDVDGRLGPEGQAVQPGARQLGGHLPGSGPEPDSPLHRQHRWHSQGEAEVTGDAISRSGRGQALAALVAESR